MLSQQNIDKLNMNGLYKCIPNLKYRSKLYEDNLYWCCNWTFKVVKNRDGEYFMRDTYWSSGDSVHIKLTDDNIDEFELVFDWDRVRRVNQSEINHYDNHYRVAVDSGGYTSPKYFVDLNAEKSKDLVIKEIDNKIKDLEWELTSLRERKENIENGTYKLEWF